MPAKKDQQDESNSKVFPIRLNPKTNALLRPAGAQKGSLASRIKTAIEGVDLDTVPVEQRRGRAKEDYVNTSIKLEKELHEQLNKVARERGTSMSALIDGCVYAFYKRRR